MRYVEELPLQEVLQQLALSERQFYRDHQRAIQTVSELLWDRLKTSQLPDNTISVKSEIQRLWHQSAYAIIDGEALLSGARAANANLAEHHQVTLHLRPVQTLGDFTAHHAVLRQTIIWMLSQIITHVAAGSDVTLSAAIIEHNPAINFEISGPATDISILHDKLTNNPTVAEFLATLNGTITITEVDHLHNLVQLRLQHYNQLILVIDDNPDVVALLERYITSMPYEIISAHDAEDGFRLAQSLELSLIILDILLPRTDGWKMLQNLKSHPRTRSTPVLICSVLDNPDLALSLGANAHLRKPPDRISFLEALGRWTASEHLPLPRHSLPIQPD
jgi:CheY-like chemotaxis protein